MNLKSYLFRCEVCAKVPLDKHLRYHWMLRQECANVYDSDKSA